MSKFIKSNYKGVIPFLDSYTIYGISDTKKNITIHLLESELKDYGSPLKRITSENEWVFV